MSMRSAALGATGLGTAAPLAAAALVAFGVELVVIGGCALVLREITDHCSDLDVVPEPGAANLACLCRSLTELGASGVSDRAIAEQSVSSVTSPYGRIDLMVATARREYDSLVAGSTEVHVAGVPVRVAAAADVLRLRAEFGGGDE
jgi:hypothetical protein